MSDNTPEEVTRELCAALSEIAGLVGYLPDGALNLEGLHEHIDGIMVGFDTLQMDLEELVAQRNALREHADAVCEALTSDAGEVTDIAEAAEAVNAYNKAFASLSLERFRLMDERDEARRELVAVTAERARLRTTLDVYLACRDQADTQPTD